MRTQAANRRRNGHDDVHRSVAVAEAMCPFCGQPISRAVETALNNRLAKEQEQAAAKVQAEIEKAKREAGKAAEAQIKAARSQQEAMIGERVRVAREAAEKKLAETVNAERAKGFAERLQLVEQLQDLQTRLDRRDRPATSLGSQGQINAMTLLVETFGKSFPQDTFGAVSPGKAGGDIIHSIVQGSAMGDGGEVIAKVLYEIKNTRLYQPRWAAKARADQLAAGCDHVVVVTSAFKSGHSELMVETNGVLVCSFDRLVAIATWLRLFCARMHTTKVSGQNRLDKTERLYAFMTSDRAQDRWQRMTQTMTRMRDALRTERITHDKLWNDRTDQLDVLGTIRDTFVEDLNSIFEGGEPGATP